MEPVRIAVVGVGHLGRHHARLLAENPRAELIAVADTSPEMVQRAVDAHGVEGVSDYRDLADRVEAVSIAAPTVAHREVAGFFLERGVDVLVEKPITQTVEEGRELVALANEHKRILQVGHIERFNPAFVALRERIAQEPEAAPRYVEAQRLAPFTFRSTDIGVVLDLMIHDLDLVNALIDSEVVSVQAFGGAVFTPAEDMASAVLKFENGAVAQLTASRVAMKAVRKMRVFSRESYASIDFNDPQGVIIRKGEGWDFGKLDVQNVDTSRIEDLWKYVFDGLLSVNEYKAELTNPLDEELSSFLERVRDRKEPVVSGEAGVRAVELAHRVLEAIQAHPW